MINLVSAIKAYGSQTLITAVSAQLQHKFDYNYFSFLQTYKKAPFFTVTAVGVLFFSLLFHFFSLASLLQPLMPFLSAALFSIFLVVHPRIKLVKNSWLQWIFYYLVFSLIIFVATKHINIERVSSVQVAMSVHLPSIFRVIFFAPSTANNFALLPPLCNFFSVHTWRLCSAYVCSLHTICTLIMFVYIYSLHSRQQFSINCFFSCTFSFRCCERAVSLLSLFLLLKPVEEACNPHCVCSVHYTWHNCTSWWLSSYLFATQTYENQFILDKQTQEYAIVRRQYVKYFPPAYVSIRI